MSSHHSFLSRYNCHIQNFLEMNLNPDPIMNGYRPTGFGGDYDEQPSETPESTELKMFIEASLDQFYTFISHQFARQSQEIQVLATAAENGQGRRNANNASNSVVSPAIVFKKFLVMLMAFGGMLGFLKSPRETVRLGIACRREYGFKQHL